MNTLNVYIKHILSSNKSIIIFKFGIYLPPNPATFLPESPKFLVPSKITWG